VASTCSPPPALDSICWGSGGGGPGRVASSFLGGSSCALSASGCLTGGSGAGVAEIGYGSYNPQSRRSPNKAELDISSNKSKEQKIHYEQGTALTESISSWWAS
jgi:hypothetical protein